MDTTHVSPLPYLVYLDNTFLIDMADDAEGRNQDALTILQLFKRHAPSQLLQIRTSWWAMAEAQSVLYEHACENAGVDGPERRDGRGRLNVRALLPPDKNSMDAASRMLLAVQKRLSEETNFAVLPENGSSDPAFWALVNKLVREGMYFPNDCVHLAIALQEGCSVILTDDDDFQQKIDYLLPSVIQPYRSQRFPIYPDLPDLPPIPPFQVAGLRGKSNVYPTNALRRNIRQVLLDNNFK